MTKVESNEEKVLAFLGKFSNSNAEVISNGTGVFKLQVHKILKGLVDKKVVSIEENDKPPVYSLASKPAETKQSTVKAKKAPEEKKGEPVNMPERYRSTGRNTSKYKFKGKEYAKGPLVLAVISDYCEKHKVSIAKLKETFPDELQPRYSTIQLLNMAKKLSTGRDRFFLKQEQLIKIGDAKVAVCNQWGQHNIEPFLKIARKLGYTIK